MTDLIVPIAISSEIDQAGDERIHLANRVANGVIRPPYVPPVPALDNIYSPLTSGSNLLVSTDGGLTFPSFVNSGSSTSSPVVYSANGRLYRLSSGSGVTTTDGTTFVPCTGLGSTSTVCGVIYTGTEWLLYNFTGNVYVSANGVDFTPRAIPTARCQGLAKSGNTLVAVGAIASNTIVHSIDNGVTWTTFSTGLSGTMNRFIATPSGFIGFGSGTNRIQRSATGLSGSWSAITSPTASNITRAARSTTTGRLVILDTTGASFYSDNDGTSWTAGGTISGIGTLSSNLQDGYLIFANGIFITNPNPTSPGTSYIYTSTDGTSWTQVFNSGGSYNIANLAAFNTG